MSVTEATQPNFNPFEPSDAICICNFEPSDTICNFL